MQINSCINPDLEFPNRIRLHCKCTDFQGKPIPTHVVLVHGPSSTFGVKNKGKEIYGLYGDNKNGQWWVSLKDADLYALPQYGFSRIHT